MDSGEITRRFERIEEQQTKAATEMSSLQTLVNNSLATRDYVTTELRPIRDSMMRTESAVTTMSQEMAGLANEVKNVYQTQDALLKEKSEQDRAKHHEEMELLRTENKSLKEKKILGLDISKTEPYMKYILTLAAIWVIVQQLIPPIIKLYLQAPKP